MKHELVAFTFAGLMLAQMSSYNGGIPITPGTSVPENNPATAIVTPRGAPPSSSPAAGAAIGSGSRRQHRAGRPGLLLRVGAGADPCAGSIIAKPDSPAACRYVSEAEQARHLPAVPFSSLALGVAGIAGGLLRGFQCGLSFHSLGVFGLTGFLFRLQGSFARGGRGSLLGEPLSGLPSLQGRLRRFSLRDTGVARGTDRAASDASRDRVGTIRRSPRFGRAFDLRLLRGRGGA